MSPQITDRRLFAPFLLGFFALCSAASAQIFVTSTGNSGPGTLRQAILDANAIPVATEEIVTIDLQVLQQNAAPGRAFINLTSGTISPTRSVYIVAGGNLPKPKIQSASAGGAIFVGAVVQPTQVTLQNLRFEGNRSDRGGAAIRCSVGNSQVSLDADHCEFVDNQVSPSSSNPTLAVEGGALFYSSLVSSNSRAVKISHCLFENNRVLSGAVAGSQYSDGSAVSLNECQVTLEDSSFIGNSGQTDVSSQGGAVKIAGASTDSLVRRCSFESNTSLPGGVSALLCKTDSSIAIEDSHFEGNQGNAAVRIAPRFGTNSTATLQNNTLVGNSGSSVSALQLSSDFGTVNLTHCTLWRNAHTSQTGTALYLSGQGNQITISRCVIAENFQSGGNQNIAISPDLHDISPASGGTISSGYNFIGDAGNLASVFTSAGDRKGTSAARLIPGLADPGNYGGPTRTCPPLPDSPLVDAIANAANVLITDQRGISRPQGFTADIGAVELPRTSYDVWDDQIPIVADRDSTDDPDHDGLQNRQEYFFGTNPMVANAAPVRLVDGDDDTTYFEVIRSASVRPLFFTRTAVETSTDLSAGSWSAPAGTTISSPETDGSLDRIRTLYPVGNDPRRFFRVGVQ